MTLLIAASTAQAGLSGLGFGVHGGLVSGYDNPVLQDSLFSSFSGFELSDKMTNIGAHAKIGTFRIIEFDAALDYAWKKQEVIPDVNLTFSDFSASGSVRKSIALAVIKPYIGAGLGLHWMAYSLDLGGQVIGVVMPENESKFGYHFKVGVDFDFPLFPLTPYAEWKYNTIQTTGKSTKYSSINVGITLDLP